MPISLLLGVAAAVAIAAGKTTRPTHLDLTSSTLSFQDLPAKAKVAAKAILLDEVNRRCTTSTTTPRPTNHWHEAKVGAATPGNVVLRFNDTLNHEQFQIRATPLGVVQITAGSVRGFALGSGRLLRELRITVHPTTNTCTVLLPHGQWSVDVDGKDQPRGTQLTTAGIGLTTVQPGAFSSWDNAEQYPPPLRSLFPLCHHLLLSSYCDLSS
jgi:hypothetical protein